jgi:predicted lipoprotein with Yx(FWY)xxD motif
MPNRYVSNRMIALSLAAAILAAAPASALAQAAPNTAAPAAIADTAKGKALVNDKGMTLYTYDRDSSGKATCSGQCATLWPPFAPAADAKAAGDWSVVTRSDGAKQWAYKGKPLYTWKDDKKPGDILGDGVNNVWRIAAP